MLSLIVFWVAALVAIAAAVRVITVRNPITCVLHLIVTLVALAVLFLQLSAEFIAILQIIIYAGAIMVLFLFIVMMLNLKRDEFGPNPLRGIRVFGGILGATFLAELFVLFGGVDAVVGPAPEGFGSVTAIGKALFGGYLFAFELTSILLLAAALAVMVVARPRRDGEVEG
ncbi:MAG TPA: NADH-quinone oxidoreductase subunit J [bacterium]|nr:NADH-quinone oxidoreductase subunit J [bacterium]